jgi:hypothetical protein
MDSGGRSAANDSQNGALRARRPERVRLNPVSSRRASSPITYERRPLEVRCVAFLPGWFSVKGRCRDVGCPSRR